MFFFLFLASLDANALRLQICNLTVARMDNVLGLHIQMELAFKGQVAKIATGGFLHPQC